MGSKQTQKAKRNLFKQAVDYALTGVALAGIGNTVVQGGIEIYEELAGDNMIVDLDYGFATVITKHRENRTPEQLFNDIEKAVVAVDGIEKAFDGTILTDQERLELLEKVIVAISEEANISTDKLKVRDLPDGVGGAYFTLYNKFIKMSIVDNKVYLNEKYIGERHIIEELSDVIHEMMHAVENENIMQSSQITKFDRSVFYSNREYIDYYSSFNEITPQLQTIKILKALYLKYHTQTDYLSIEERILPNMLKEIMFNLYDISTMENHRYLALDFIPFQYMNTIGVDSNNYKLLTIEEMILKGFEKKLDAANIEHSDVDLKETHYYKTFTSVLDEYFLETRYIDFINNNYDVQIDDVEEYIVFFEADLNSDLTDAEKNELKAKTLAKFTNVFRYELNYSAEEKLLMSHQFFKYIGDISNTNIKKYGLQDAGQIVSEQISGLSSLDEEMQV